MQGDNGDATERFLADMATVRVKGAGRDAALLRLGAAMMPAGIALAVVSWFISRNTDNPLDQRDAVIMAIVGLAVTMTGVGLFVRYSLADFFRFWLARLIHQQDQALRAASAPVSPVSAPDSDAADSDSASVDDAVKA